MARFKLLAGKHVGNAPGWTRSADGKYHGPDGQITDKPAEMTYGAGEAGGIFIESDSDLVKTFGKNKFERVSGSLSSDTKAFLGDHQAAAPGGQVSEGFQVTTTGPDGKSISGVMTEASIPKAKREKLVGKNLSNAPVPHGSPKK